MVLNLVTVMIAACVLCSYLIERRCILDMSDYIAPVWPTSLLAIVWAVELGVTLKRFFYEITENTLTLLIICGFALMVRLPATIGSIIMMRNGKEKEE